MLDTVYGVTSRITYHVFVELMTKEAQWCMSAPKLREKIFGAAEIKIKHKN